MPSWNYTPRKYFAITGRVPARFDMTAEKLAKAVMEEFGGVKEYFALVDHGICFVVYLEFVAPLRPSSLAKFFEDHLECLLLDVKSPGADWFYLDWFGLEKVAGRTISRSS